MSTNTTFEVHPTRSVFDASRTALGALILRDLVVLWKTKREFVLRTLIQPFLLCFVFSSSSRRSARLSAARAPSRGRFRDGARARCRRHLGHVPGCPIDCAHDVQEFASPRDRGPRSGPCPIWLVAMSKSSPVRCRASSRR